MDPELCKDIILDHSQRPRNHGTLVDSTATVEGMHRETGDWVKLSIKHDGDRLTAIGFEVQGSAVLMASCSLMTVFAKGKQTKAVAAGIDQFLGFLEDTAIPAENLAVMGDVVALAGIRQFPARVKCAALPWRTLRKALAERDY